MSARMGSNRNLGEITSQQKVRLASCDAQFACLLARLLGGLVLLVSCSRQLPPPLCSARDQLTDSAHLRQLLGTLLGSIQLLRLCRMRRARLLLRRPCGTRTCLERRPRTGEHDLGQQRRSGLGSVPLVSPCQSRRALQLAW